MNLAIRRRSNAPRFEALEGRSLLSAAGTPDSLFGGGTGYASVPIGLPSVHPEFSDEGIYNDTVATLPSGNIVVTGMVFITDEKTDVASAELVVAEFNANGTVDTSFGKKGLVQLPTTFGDSYATVGLASGQVVLAEGTGSGFIAVRLNANGSIDTTFGTGGIAQYPAGTTTPAADQLGGVTSALLQPDGKIVLVGSSVGSSTGSAFAAVRLNTDGSIDTTFGTDGTADVPMPVTVKGDNNGTVTGAALQSNGQIVVTGNAYTGQISQSGFGPPFTSTTDIVVLRLNADGSLDTTYGGSTAAGIVLLPPDPSQPTLLGQPESSGIAIDPTTGNVLVSGTDTFPYGETTLGPRLYQLNTDGTLDSSFGTGGLVFPALSGSVAVESNGQIIVAGALYYSESPVIEVTGLTSSVGVLELNADGTADTSFGNTSTPGLFQARTPEFFEFGGLSIQSNGEILLAGFGDADSLDGQLEAFSVTSLLPVASTGPAATPAEDAPADLGGGGFTDAAVYNPSTASFIYVSPTRETGTIPFGITGAGQTIPAVADYLGNGQDQIAAYLPASGVYAILPTGIYGGEYANPDLTAASPGLFEKFGVPGTGQSIPVPANYYGTGQADVAVYLPNQGIFAIQDPTGKTSGEVVRFGIAGIGKSIPAPGDYYGTGQDDIAVYLTASGVFAIQDPSGKTTGEEIPFGIPGYGKSVPVPGDYDGSGKTEVAVYIPSQGAFYYRPADGGNDVRINIGTANSGEIAVPGDYDGSGMTEAAVYSASGGYIIYAPANGGPDVTIDVGTANNGSIPVAEPAAFPSAYRSPLLLSGINAEAIAPSGSTASTVAITVSTSTSSAVPSGPTLASIRVALAPVNQGGTDPLKFAS